MHHREIIADDLSKAGWTSGCIEALDSEGQNIFVVVAHRDGKRFIVRADEKVDRLSGARIATSGQRDGFSRKRCVLRLWPDVRLKSYRRLSGVLVKWLQFWPEMSSQGRNQRRPKQ
jgi:hypothetical protein